MNLKASLILLVLLHFNVALKAQDYRYTETVFSSSVITENVVYGTAPFIDSPHDVESNTTVGDLKMDIYLPEGDTNINRPAIIFAHSGGFILGNKNHDDMMAFCDLLSKKGYVTATINYRKGFNLTSNANLHGTRSVYRGMQDGRTAVRYMRANAATYGVDANKIYFVGSSAGAFIGLHSIYMNENSEIPTEAGVNNYTNLTPPLSHTTPDLGALNIGNNLSYNGEPDVLVSLWGAVKSTDLITLDNDKPVLLVHGESDTVVPFGIGYPFSFPLLDNVYGSNEINTKLENLGLTNNETYFVPGEGHEFYGVSNGTWDNGEDGNSYWDIILNKISNFLWLQHKPTANFTSMSSDLIFNFTDTSIGGNSWLWDFGDGTTSTEQNPSHTYTTEGDYEVKLYIENDILSWDEITNTVQTGTLSINDTTQLDFSYYPNPTKNSINFTFEETYPLISLKLFNVSGQLISKSEFLNSSKAEVKLNDVGQGIYFMKVEKDNKVFSLKVVKN